MYKSDVANVNFPEIVIESFRFRDKQNFKLQMKKGSKTIVL